MSLEINPVLCRPNVMDNYAYIIRDTVSGKVVIVDAAESEPIISKCEALGLKPDYILATHHHFDHVGGHEDLKKKYGLQIVCPDLEKDKIPFADQGVVGGDVLKIGEMEIHVIDVPGHTLGHVLWYFPKDKVVFTGDVLFNLCIGGLFEGTASQMWHSLNKIKELPDDVLFYPGHEYTASCLPRHVEKGTALAEYVDKAIEKLRKKEPVSPVSLGLEKMCNPYLQIKEEKYFVRLF